MFSLINTIVVPGFFLLALLNCSAAQRETPSDQWPEMEFIIDGKAKIRLIVPPAQSDSEVVEPQFIFTSIGSMERLFSGLYDPGWGSDRDLLLTHIGSNIIRMKRGENDESGLSLENIVDEIYLVQDGLGESFEIAGDVKFNDRSWLQVNFIGDSRKGVAYSTIIDGGYALLISLSIYGEKIDQTRLYRHRLETLKTIVKSVKTSTE